MVPLSSHSFGCRVVQRVLENCEYHPKYSALCHTVVESALELARNQFGNYVCQHVAAHGSEQQRRRILELLSPHLLELSQQKFASNVVEKAVEFAPPGSRSGLVERALGSGTEALLQMVRDQFGNYIVQKLLATCSPRERYRLLGVLRENLPALRRSPYAKHLVSRVDQLQLGSDEEAAQEITAERWQALQPSPSSRQHQPHHLGSGGVGGDGNGGRRNAGGYPPQGPH